jgi:prevent-host-death family protein
MTRIPAIIPVSDLRHGVAEVLQRVKDTREPLVITQRGRAAAVLLNVREYERTMYERDLLLALVQGEKEIQEGKGFSLDEVMSDAEALLSEGS